MSSNENLIIIVVRHISSIYCLPSFKPVPKVYGSPRIGKYGMSLIAHEAAVHRTICISGSMFTKHDC